MPPDAKTAGPGFIRRKPLLTAFAVQAVLTVLTFVFFRPHFTTNDDAGMRMIVQGVGFALTPDAHLCYSHLLLGQFLKSAYAMVPGIPWYGLFHLGVLFLAEWAVLSAILGRDPSKTKILLFACVYGYASVATALQLNFTTTSVVAFLGGVFLLVRGEGLTDRPLKRGEIWLGSLCLIASFLSRPTAFFFSALACLPYFFFRLRGTFRGRPARHIAFFLLLLAMAGYGADLAAYRLDPRWGNYFGFNKLQTTFSHRDVRLLGKPDKLKPVLETIDWTSNDLALFGAWYFFDQEIYTREALTHLLNALPRFGWEGKPETFRSVWRFLSQGYLRDLMYLELALLLGCRGFFLRRIILQTVWILSLVLLLGFVAKTPSRLVFPLLAFPVWWALEEHGVLWKLDLQDPAHPTAWVRRIGWLFLSLSFLFLAPAFKKTFEGDKALRGREARFRDSVTHLAPREDQLYIAWAGGFPLASAPVLGDRAFPGRMRLFLLDGFQRTPIGLDMLERFSVRRPFRDLVGRSDIFLILRPQDWTLYAAHLWEHYGIKVRAVPVLAEDPLLVVRVEEVRSKVPRSPR
jgi:hypothetical protein